MAAEVFRVIDNKVDTIPQGVDGTGTLTQNVEVSNVFNGTGTDLDVELGKNAEPWIFIPGTTPPQLLEVKAFNGAEWVQTKTAPDVAVTGEAFKIVFATRKNWGLLNKGNTSAYLNGDSSNGIEIPFAQTETASAALWTGNSGYKFKDVVFVDATGTIVEVYEQK